MIIRAKYQVGEPVITEFFRGTVVSILQGQANWNWSRYYMVEPVGKKFPPHLVSEAEILQSLRYPSGL